MCRETVWIERRLLPSNATLTLDGGFVVVCSSGAFYFSTTAGTHHLNATVPGFGEVDRTIVVNPGATTHAVIALSPLASSGFGVSTTTLAIVVAVVLAVAILVGFWAWRRRR